MLRGDWFILEVCVVTCRERLRSKFSGLRTLIDKNGCREILKRYSVFIWCRWHGNSSQIGTFWRSFIITFKKGCKLWRYILNGFPSTYTKSDRKRDLSIFLGFIFCSGSHPRNEGIYEETSREGRSRLGWRIRLSKTRRTNGRGQW